MKIEAHSNRHLIDMFKLGPEYIANNIKFVKNPFWKDVYMSYYNFCSTISSKDAKEIKREYIFFNKKITAGGKTLFRRRFLDRGIYTINDVVKSDGTFLSFQNMIDTYGNITNFLDYASIISSIKAYIKNMNINLGTSKLDEPMMPLPLSILLQAKKGCRIIYDRLFDNKRTPTSLEKWHKELNIDVNSQNILSLFKLSFKCCIDTFLQWFQSRINHMILGTNYLLKKINITDNDLCSLCQQEKETIVHLFCICPYVQEFWKNIEILINTHQPIQPINLSSIDIIFGNKYYSDVLNTILIMCKHYIFKVREADAKPNIEIFKKYILNRYKVDKHIAEINMKKEIFEKKWKPFINLIHIIGQ